MTTLAARLQRGVAAALLALGLAAPAAGAPPKPAKPSAYLFVYFTGHDKQEEAIRFALSPDGYHYTALNSNRPVISSAAISQTGGVRDPHILRGHDGKTFLWWPPTWCRPRAGTRTAACCCAPPTSSAGSRAPCISLSATPARQA